MLQGSHILILVLLIINILIIILIISIIILLPLPLQVRVQQAEATTHFLLSTLGAREEIWSVGGLARSSWRPGPGPGERPAAGWYWPLQGAKRRPLTTRAATVSPPTSPKPSPPRTSASSSPLWPAAVATSWRASWRAWWCS